jgi:hypothetical protein
MSKGLGGVEGAACADVAGVADAAAFVSVANDRSTNCDLALVYPCWSELKRLLGRSLHALEVVWIWEKEDCLEVL